MLRTVNTIGCTQRICSATQSRVIRMRSEVFAFPDTKSVLQWHPQAKIERFFIGRYPT
jgi:hypothetical protein